MLSYTVLYHQTNLGCKSFSISEDLVETAVAITLNIAKWYFCMILWLMMMHHHTKFDRSEILSGQTFTEVQNLQLNTAKQPFHKTLQLMNMYCQTKLSPQNHDYFYYVFWSVDTSEHIIEIVMISSNESKLSYCYLDLEDSNPFFTRDTLAYNDVSSYWVWLRKVQRFIRYHPK